MQRLARTLSLLLLLALTAFPVFADNVNPNDLNGANVTVNYLYPEIDDVYEVLGTGTVTSSGFTVNSFGQHDFTVYPTEFTLTNVAGADITFTSADFNGYGIVVNSGGSSIIGVTLIYSDVDGFDISRVTWDNHDIWLNMEGLVTTPGLDLEIGIDFAGGGTVPEPSSFLLLGSGVIGIAGIARRKLRR